MRCEIHLSRELTEQDRKWDSLLQGGRYIHDSGSLLQFVQPFFQKPPRRFLLNVTYGPLTLFEKQGYGLHY